MLVPPPPVFDVGILNQPLTVKAEVIFKELESNTTLVLPLLKDKEDFGEGFWLLSILHSVVELL